MSLPSLTPYQVVRCPFTKAVYLEQPSALAQPSASPSQLTSSDHFKTQKSTPPPWVSHSAQGNGTFMVVPGFANTPEKVVQAYKTYPSLLIPPTEWDGLDTTTKVSKAVFLLVR